MIPVVVVFAAAQGMVDAIWAEMGLRYPPCVERLPGQARRRIADANRLRIRLHAATPSWCLLHELAHAMTTAQDGASDGHGAGFVGLYMRLLVRYLRLDPAMLRDSLHQAGISFDAEARPVFCDAV